MRFHGEWTGMQVRVLGPIDVVAGAGWRPVSGPRRKAILAVLALHWGEVVDSEKLADVVWGDHPPATARNTLQRHLSYLRGVLGNRMAIVARPPGYLLDPGAAGTDLEAARRLIREGAKVADRAHEEQLREALALWRGRALADVDGLPWLREQAEHLEGLRLQGVRALAQTRLALGEHERLLPELEALSRDNPFDEQLHGLLMLALYRSGRQADALTAYRRLREVLRDDLAIDPGRQLRDLQAAILRQDQALDVASDTERAAPAGPAALPRAAPRVPQTPRAVARGSASSLGTPLLEREGPLVSLREFAAQAQGGTGRLVLIGGEAGVGKSMLAERLQQELRGARWSWGGCDGLFTPRPLGPLFDLAGQLGGALQEKCGAGADRDELFRALLSQVSVPGELNVVVVEDIHWADEATLDLLRYLGRRLRTAPVLLIISYRNDELAAADDPLQVALGDLAALRWTRRVELAPLSAHAVEVLAEGSGLAADDLFRLTGGNPFYVSEVLKAGTAQVPLSARDAVLARAARLGDGARELLDAAALAGSRVEVRMLEAVTRCEPAALDELVASGLMAADGGRLRFRHEIARLAVARAVAVPRARAIHGRMLATLASAGGEDDARLAFHAEQAGDDAATVRYAAAAAQRAAQLGAHREAAAQYERALRSAGGSDRPVLAMLHDGFAQEAALLDRWQEAARAQERALALWRQAGDPLREGDALWRLSRIRLNMCRGREALAAARAAVSVLEALSPSVELARAYATYACQQMLSADYDSAAGLSGRASELAIRLGIMDVHSDALNTRAMSYAAQGLDWAAQLNRALEIALSGGHHSQAARAYCNLSSNHLDARDFALAEPYLAEGIA
jgi:DNA-binding SARP family transcriptional activator/tetratricopeptide (TPR) repeat protein